MMFTERLVQPPDFCLHQIFLYVTFHMSFVATQKLGQQQLIRPQRDCDHAEQFKRKGKRKFFQTIFLLMGLGNS